MSARIGPVTISQDGARFLETRMPWERERNVSEEMSRIADEEVSRIVTEGYERAKSILRSHETALRGVAEELKRVEVLTGDQLRELVSRLEAEPAPETRGAVT